MNIEDQGTGRVRVQYIGPAPLNDTGADLIAMNSVIRGNPLPAEMPVATARKPMLADLSVMTGSSSNLTNPPYVVQLGPFETLPEAERARFRFENMGPVEISTVATGSDIFFGVRIGPLSDPVQAKRALQVVMNAGYPDAKLIAHAL